MKKKVIFVASTKGGVGKTLTAMALVEYLRSQKKDDGSPWQVAAYDTDVYGRQLALAYGLREANGDYSKAKNKLNPTKGVAIFDARTDRDSFAETLDSDPDFMVMDLPTGLIDMSHVHGDMAIFKKIYGRRA